MPTPAESIQRLFVANLEKVRTIASSCDDVIWSKSPKPSAPSVCFHAWHVARWMDYFRDAFVGPGTELWESEGMAGGWGLGDRKLGFAATGMGMSDEVPPLLAAVARADVLAYVDRALDGAVALANSFASGDLELPYSGHRQAEWMTQWGSPSVAAALLAQIEHSARHLGMIEAMIGVQGRSGSATR